MVKMWAWGYLMGFESYLVLDTEFLNNLVQLFRYVLASVSAFKLPEREEFRVKLPISCEEMCRHSEVSDHDLGCLAIEG